MQKKPLHKTFNINAEMFGKASFFVGSRSDFREYVKGVSITPSSALNNGINILATNGHYLVIFNDSTCNSLNFPDHRIWIDCVYQHKGKKLTNFIKDCRTKAVLKRHQNFQLTFLNKTNAQKCQIRFNNRKYTFNYGTHFPEIDPILSKIRIPLKNEAMSYNPQFIEKVKHINLSWHPKDFHDLLLLSRCDSGELLAIKPGVIYIAMPLISGKKKSAIQRFVRGVSADSKDKDDIFSKAYKKQAFKKEFGSLLANELTSKKASF